MIEVNFVFGKYRADRHTMYFDSTDELHSFVKRLDEISSVKYTYVWKGVDGE